jgi:hypothetical protein
MKPIKQYNLGGCIVGITDGRDLWVYRCNGMVYIPRFMKTGSDIHVVLRLLPRQFERLQCWYYLWEGLLMYVIEMTSDYITHTYQVL